MLATLSGGKLARAFTRVSTRYSAPFSRHGAELKHSLWKRSHWSEYYKSNSGKTDSGIFMSADDDTATRSLDITWNLGGLKKEVSRLTVRCHKKVGKANQRLENAKKEVERLTGDPDVTMEELENCPNVEGLEQDFDELQTRLKNLNQLEVLLQDVKGKNAALPEHIAELVFELEVQDKPPKIQPRGPKKEKGPTKMESFRLPYRRYYTTNKTEIRVSFIQ